MKLFPGHVTPLSEPAADSGNSCLSSGYIRFTTTYLCRESNCTIMYRLPSPSWECYSQQWKPTSHESSPPFVFFSAHEDPKISARKTHPATFHDQFHFQELGSQSSLISWEKHVHGHVEISAAKAFRTCKFHIKLG